jgi:cytochrome P450
VTVTADVYYDPYDFGIDTDPYPVWKRLRDEQPLYHNERYDFWALSRFDDVEEGLKDWRTFTSGHGTLLELIKSDFRPPPGIFIHEDPPLHDVHRSVLSRVFTPRKMNALEPQVRAFCARTLDPLVGSGRFDFVKDLGAQMPMRVIGMLLGIPEQDQEAIRDRIDAGLHIEDGDMAAAVRTDYSFEHFNEYIDWRVDHPSDDVTTDLLNAEFEDETGTVRRLRRDELLGYIGLLAAAGNETTTKLIGWTGKVLGEHPDQRKALVEDRSLIRDAIEEVLRYESPSPVQGRYVAADVELHGQVVPEGSAMLLLNASGNRDEREFEDADRFDIRRKIDHHLAFGYGLHFCLGAALARLEGRIALDEVLNRFPDWEVDLDHAVQARTSTVRGWDSLPVVVP